MIQSFSQHTNAISIYSAQRRAQLYWALWFLLIIGITCVTALFMLYIKPIPVPLGAIVAVATLMALWYRPHWGLYIIILFSLLGDGVLWPWYPFTKNLSSAESILYINSALIFSPLELMMGLVLFIWLVKGVARYQLDLYHGALFWPVIAFALFLSMGLLHGLGTGGNANIALWEVRPIFYIPLMMILVSNLLKNATQINLFIYLAMAALFLEGIVGCYDYFVTLHMNLAGVEAITEHSAAIHMNTLFVFALASWLYRTPMVQKWALIFAIPPVLLTYLVTQRRAAFLSLGMALVLMTLILYQENRKAFWRIVPATAIFALLYIGAFWHSNGLLGLPASAVRSIVAPDANSADALSNLYRQIENTNVNFTIHMVPLTGVGFGQKFYILVPMPDISFFIWWEYIVHNSIFWIWMKLGMLGFIALLFLICFGVMHGLHVLQHTRDDRLRAVVLTATLYLVMHFMYAYVDMSWDNQSMLYIGAMLGLIESTHRVSKGGEQREAAMRLSHADKGAVYG